MLPVFVRRPGYRATAQGDATRDLQSNRVTEVRARMIPTLGSPRDGGGLSVVVGSGLRFVVVVSNFYRTIACATRKLHIEPTQLSNNKNSSSVLSRFLVQYADNTGAIILYRDVLPIPIYIC